MVVVPVAFDKLSTEARDILGTRVGWRNDSIYGSGIEDVFSILDYEVNELGNTDILYTCRKLYGLKMDLRRRRQSVVAVKRFIRSVFPSGPVYAKWFATYPDVVRLYAGNESCVGYRIPQNVLVLSDLGHDGCLLVSNVSFWTV